MSYVKLLAAERYGASAVEFAVVAPLFIIVLFTMIGYAVYFSAALSVEQIAADAARYSVAGLTPEERASLAQHYIDQVTLDDPLIERDRLEIEVGPDPKVPEQFTVSLSYDASALPIWNLLSFSMPSRRIERVATIRVGGA